MTQQFDGRVNEKANQTTDESANRWYSQRDRLQRIVFNGPLIVRVVLRSWINDHSWDQLIQSRRRSPSSIGGQFRRVSSTRAQFCESLTSLQLVPCVEKSKFWLSKNEDGCRVQISRFVLLRRSVYS